MCSKREKNVRVKDENQNVDHCQSAGTDAIGLMVWSERRKGLLMGDFALMQSNYVHLSLPAMRCLISIDLSAESCVGFTISERTVI